MMSVGRGKHKVWVKEELTKEGIVLMVFGGDKPHVGSVVLAEPRLSRTGRGISTTSQVLNLLGHKEEEIARKFAEEVCKRIVQPVVCVCGIHTDDASKKDIQTLNKNAKTLLKKYVGG